MLQVQLLAHGGTCSGSRSGGVRKEFCLLKLREWVQRHHPCGYSFTCTFNGCSLSASYRPGTVVGPGDPMVNKTDRVSSFMEVTW